MALAVTIVLAIAKLVVWLATGSLAVLSQSLDSLLDIASLTLVLAAVRIGAKPADPSHHFGHSKAENLVAFGQAVLLGGIVILIATEALARWGGAAAPPDVPWYALALLATSAVIDSARAWYMASVARAENSAALRAAALNIASDVGTAVIALVGLAAVRSGATDGDSIAALLVSAVVAFAAFHTGRRAIDVLMDRAPAGLVEQISDAASKTAGVTRIRRVRVRGERGQTYADVVVSADRTATVERAHDIADKVETAISEAVAGIDVVVHVEPDTQASGLVERVQAAASRVTGVYEIHNVLVHAFQEGGRTKLHATLHAKAEAGLTIADAHALSDAVEDAVQTELGSDTRVDSQIEPLERTTPGRDVTTQRNDLVELMTRHAMDEPDVIDCHEVIVTETAGKLAIVAHVRGRRDMSLARIHDASHRIEQAVYAAEPSIGSVLLHFEPA